MMNPVKKDIITPSAYKHLPRVMQMMEELETKRHELGAAFLKKKFRFLDGTVVLLHAMIGFNKIIMWGGGSYPHIVLTDYSGAWTYDWYADSIASRSFPAGYTGQDPLKPSFNGRSQLLDEAHLTYLGNWSAEIIDDGHNTEWVGGLNENEMTLFQDGQKIFGRVGDLYGQVADIPAMPIMNAQYGSLFMFGVAHPIAWNLYSGLRGITFSPFTKHIQDSFYWIPSFFVAEPADAYSLPPGFYYGKYPYSDYGIEQALVSATVTLKGIVSTRYTGEGAYKYGWAEYVSEINGDPHFDLHFYLQEGPLSVPSNPNSAYMRIAGTFADRYHTVGWAGGGFDATLKMTLDAEWQDFELDMWNHDAWENTESLLGSSVCGVSFILIKGNKAKAYRFTGALTLLMETEEYHSHSISPNGQLFAIFEGADVITKATAWDLYGTREVTFDGEDTYERGAPTVLADRTEVVAVGALTACLIPNRYHVGQPDEYQPSELPYNLLDFAGSNPIEDYSLYMPSMGVIFFGERGIAPTFKKIVFDGLTARYGISTDPCFDSLIILEDPDAAGGVKEEQLIGWWDYGGILKGVVRGNFIGNHPNMRFQGVGQGQEITLADTFYMFEYIDGTIKFEGYSGELQIGNCIVEDAGEYRIDHLCSNCGEDFVATASSSCGQTAERPYEIEPLPDMYITGPDVIGGTYQAHNGYLDIKYSVSCGTINEDTGEILDATGCCGTVTVSAVDECGRSASLQVRGLTGSWFTVDVRAATGNPCADPPTADVGACSQYDVCSPGCCYCDISSCYTAGYIYYGPTVRRFCLQRPAWLGSGTIDCDGVETYTPVYTQAFYCPDGDPDDDCIGVDDPDR